MNTLHVTARRSSDGVVERDITVGEIPGVIWSPESAPDDAPLVLIGHGGGQHKRTPALVDRARRYVTGRGVTVVAIDAPGHGDRPRTDTDERARAALGAARESGDPERFASVSIDYAASLTERAVPEWRAVLDALPEVDAGAPVGYGGGITLGTAIGIPLTAAEPRITAAVFGGGFFVHDALLAAARRVTVPVEFLLTWDDEHVGRAGGLALFDAFAAPEKTLHANPGRHGQVPWYEDNAFFFRHLGRAG